MQPTSVAYCYTSFYAVAGRLLKRTMGNSANILLLNATARRQQISFSDPDLSGGEGKRSSTIQ
jgi:hypothetical protein